MSTPVTALDNTFGALLIGVIIASVLYGLTCIQTWYYFAAYPSDMWYLKFLVLAVLVSDTCHQAMIAHLIYTYLITYFGVFEELGNIVWSLIVEVYFNGFTTLIVQCFLTWRIFRLSNRNWFLVASVMVLVIAEFLMILVYSGKAIHFQTYEQLKSLKALSMAVNVTAAVGDIYIAMLLCYLLQRSRTGFRRSDTMINKLVMFSVNTGLLTSLCALGSLICITLWPNTFIYIAFYFSIGRLYCNSFLATLNARRTLRGGYRDDDMSLSLQGCSARKTTTTMVGTSSKPMPNNISIKIDTVQEHLRDDHYSPSGEMKNPEDLELTQYEAEESKYS